MQNSRLLLATATLLLANSTTQVRCSAFELRVGAAIVDVTPNQLPVLVNGSMTSRSEDQIKTHVNARAIVLDDGHERIGIVVVDSCMLPRQLLDEAKQLAATQTKLRPERIMISATHTHTAPSSMGALGTDADPSYVPYLRQKLVEALVTAEAGMVPARVGWGSGMAPEFTALRRWVLRPDRKIVDPFGNLTVRANMHAARDPENAIGPSGPEDPELSMIAFQSLDGHPLAVLANFSMHYFGDSAISSDYFGLFCDGMQAHMEKDVHASSCVAIMSHGCSGDIWRRDYMQSQAVADGTIEAYSQGLLGIATKIYSTIEYQSDATLAMLESRIRLNYRVPDAQRLKWAQDIVATMGDRLPQTQPEIYAREQIYLHALQSTEVVVQAIRIGDIALMTTPCETYALTGLKLKLQSPLSKTMVIELANGGDGYIPPPEQHFLGGYNTWAARSAGLEETAEPKIVAANLKMIESICASPRRKLTQSQGPAVTTLLQAKPVHYWRLDEANGNSAIDLVSGTSTACYEPGVVYFLEGPDNLESTAGPLDYTLNQETNRSAHFAGGRMTARLSELVGDFSVQFSCWNGMPANVRPVAGWFFSRDEPFGLTAQGLHVGLGGSNETAGRLIVQVGERDLVVGKTAIDRWTWHRVSIVKSGSRLDVYLDATQEPEISVELDAGQATADSFFFGGRSDNDSNWEGRLDEIAVFDYPHTVLGLSDK
jgi:hypothetical protein